MDGWAALGNVMAGGIDREGAHAQGMELGAKTQNALAQARVRRVEEAAKRDEYENKQTLAESLFKAGLAPDYRTAEGLAGINRAGAGNVQALMSARQTGQQMGLADTIMDPSSSIETMQRARLAGGDSAFDPYSMRGGLMYDIFNPGEPQDMYQTPESLASIRQREASAALSDERRLNPERFRSNTNIVLGDALTGGGEDLPARRDIGTVDFGGATGVTGLGARVGNIVADLFGQDLPFPTQERGVQELSRLRGDTLGAAQAEFPGRPSNYLLQVLEPYTVKPADLMQGEGRAFENFVTTREKLVDDFYDMHNILANPTGVSKNDISKIKLRYEKMRQLIGRYDRVIESIEANRASRGPQASAAGGDPAPEGIDPEAWGAMTPEEKARVMQILGGAQ